MSDFDKDINVPTNDTISRRAAIDAVCMEWCNVKHQNCEHPFDIEKDDYYWCDGCETALQTLPNLPSAQPERDIPMKPNETIDSSWGIRKKQAVCPKCDYYLNRIYFLGDSKNKKVTYCETCGQAIDWEGWEWEE